MGKFTYQTFEGGTVMIDGVIGLDSEGYALSIYDLCEIKRGSKQELGMIVYDESEFRFAFRVDQKKRVLVHMNEVDYIKKLCNSEYDTLRGMCRFDYDTPKGLEEIKRIDWFGTRKVEILRSDMLLTDRAELEKELGNFI